MVSYSEITSTQTPQKTGDRRQETEDRRMFTRTSGLVQPLTPMQTPLRNSHTCHFHITQCVYCYIVIPVNNQNEHKYPKWSHYRRLAGYLPHGSRKNWQCIYALPLCVQEAFPCKHHAHTHIRTHTHVRTHTHTYIHTRTHTQTHTHTNWTV